MIISNNPKPTFEDFKSLMHKTDEFLNSTAKEKEAYYAARNSEKLELDVCDALKECAKGTPFDGSIEHISGKHFPDIVACRFYGVEVKSTNKNHWYSIGSSILESSRIKDVERIFLTFGKLGSPVEFRSRPYEECLSGISVTHYPRYQIDMELPAGETVFDKMGIPYDELRKMDNPVAPVSKYYKSQLKSGESLWWASDGNIEASSAPPVVKLWNTLSKEEQTFYKVKGCALFPELFTPVSTTKYHRYALWLAISCGIINTNVRDAFTAGGKQDIQTDSSLYSKMPAIFSRVAKYKDLIAETILSEDENTLSEYWQVEKIEANRIEQWCALAAGYADKNNACGETYKILCVLFGLK